jgi:CheY-like chemotaxis protein
MESGAATDTDGGDWRRGDAHGLFRGAQLNAGIAVVEPEPVPAAEPVPQPGAAHALPQSSGSKVALHRRAQNVLVVEDETNIMDLIKYNLVRETYSVICVGSGEAALAAVLARKPDLILLDIMLPGIDGYEVCRRLKGHRGMAHIPVIFVSARSAPADILEGFRAGADDYITKPFSTKDLIGRIREFMRGGPRRDF